MRNLKLALRTLFKTPFVTTVAVLSLALGIGANAAIFSEFDQLLLQPLPVPHPERLVNFAAPGPKDGSNSCNMAGECDEVFSYPMFRDLQRAKTAFSGIAGHVIFGVNLAMAGQTPLSGMGMFVSGSYFPVLGVKPALGRLLAPSDDDAIGGHFVAVLSYPYWQNQLGSNPTVVGQQITINGQSMTIVGVAANGFTGTTLAALPYVFVPISMRAALTPGWKGFERRDSYWIYVFGRLAPGATLAQARASINAIYTPILQDIEAPQETKMSARTLQQFKSKTIVLSDGRHGQSSISKSARVPLLLLFAITGIVLLIACANIANLLLARAATRSMEMAVRLSLGASRRQLVAQLLTESVLLAALGGAASLVVAQLTLRGITAMLPVGQLALEFSVSTGALWFTAAVSLGTGILFGVVPALHSTRPDLVTELRNNSGKLSGGRGAARFRSTLVTAQIALSMALLVSAGLFIKSLRNVSRTELGVDIESVVTFGISPERSGYDSAGTMALYARLEDALAAVPGVTAVTTSSVPLLSGSNWGSSVSVEGFRKDPDTDADARFSLVGPNYFHVLRVPILAGRDIDARDDARSQKVAVVNEAFARKFHLGANPVGKRMSIGNDSLNIEIVGLAKDAKYSEVKDKIPPVFVAPYRQAGRLGSNQFYVRAAIPADQTIRAVRATLRGIDPNLPMEEFKTMSQQVKENVFLDRMISTMSAAFAALATLLAAIGLYGVLAYTVAQRTREIGVRMALGADGPRVRRLVLRQVGTMTLIGAIFGIAGAIALGRVAQSLLYQLKGWDPAVLSSAVVALAAVAFAAGLVPALRASRIDPMQALRYE